MDSEYGATHRLPAGSKRIDRSTGRVGAVGLSRQNGFWASASSSDMKPSA